MSFKMPSTDQVRKLGDSLGMEVTEDYANSFINFIRPFGVAIGCLRRCRTMSPR